METTVGQVIINDMLPEDMRDYNRVWDKKTKGKVLTDLVRRHPDQFKEVSQNLLRFGARAAYETGGQSFGIEDIAPTKVSKEFQKVMGQRLQQIMRNAYRRGKTSADPEVQQEIADAAIPWMHKIDEGINKELGYDNPFYRQAFGTGAQKPGTLRSIVGADVFYVDQNNKRVPIPVTHGYAQGLTPAEYFIQSFGTRKGMVDLQKATQDAGFLCLAKGTQVRMADMSVKQIEHIKEGDWVLGIEDIQNPKGKPVKVTHLFDNGLRNCYKTSFGSSFLISTLRHKILCKYEKDENEILPVGASFRLKAATIQGTFVSIKERTPVGRLHTYDIEVDSPNHLFVLANGLIVSNSKQLVQIAHRLVVTDKDDPDPNGYDPNMPIGYPVDTDDPDNEGAYLARDVGGYTRNTLLTPKILGDLKSKGIKNILIRSVMVGGPANGGVYAYDCGIREKGRLPMQGDFVGINAVQAISEPLTQGAISSKHSGGVAGADSGKAISGFKYINQLIQVPKHFQGGATHAETDGVVGKIENAPQGGKYVYINGIQHYVGRTRDGDVPLKVKPGDRVEAGDVLTEGIPNPAMIVKYKGIGEGRRYFTNMFRAALDTAGTPVHRRNLEALSRGLINYVRLTDEVGDYAPEDVLPYSMIEKDYKPREDARVGSPSMLEECYLERPVLHYTIGTQLRPSVIKELQKYGIKQVCAHKDPPPFESEMIRGMAHVSYDPDWATRLLGAYNKDSLLEGARRGATSSAESTSYVPAIAFGNQDFGHIGPLKQASVKQADMMGGGSFWGPIGNPTISLSSSSSSTPRVEVPREYSSIDDFVNSGNQFNRGDSIRMPQGQLLTNAGAPRTYKNSRGAYDPGLQAAFTVGQEIQKYAPFYTRPGNDYLYPYRFNGIGGSHEQLGNGIDYFVDNNSGLNPYGIFSHEPVHDFATGARLQWSNPYNIRPYAGSKSLSYQQSRVNQYNTEQPTTSNEWGRVLLPFLQKQYANEREGTPELPMDWDTSSLTQGLSYRDTMQQMPYMYFMPQISPFGFNHDITPEEWASYTVPMEYDPGTESMREVSYNPMESPLYNASTTFNDIVSHLGMRGKVDKYAVPTQFQVFNQISQVPSVNTGGIATISGWSDPRYQQVSATGNLTSIANKNPIADPTSQMALYYARLDPESVAEKLNKDFPDMPQEQKDMIIAKHKRLQELDANEREYFTQYAQPMWIARHARRGVNVVNGEVTPHAHLQGASQQNDPNRKDEWNHVYRQVLERSQQYRDNPYYLNVMRNWEMSPWGDGMLSEDRQPTITLEQMYEMLGDFDAADEDWDRTQKAQERMQNPFINYNPTEMEYMS